MTRQNLLLLLTPCTGHSQYKNCFQAFVWSAPSDCILWQQEMGKSKTKLSYCWQISPKSESQLGPWEEGGIVLWLPRETVSPNYVLRISFEMIRKKLRSPLWRWDRYSYEEGLMAPLDAKGSFIPGYSFSSIHSIKTVTNLHPSLSLNVFHRTLSSPRAQGPFGGQRLEPTAKKSPKHVSNILCCITKAH